MCPAQKAPNPIDRASFILGMITAFAECVTNECKKLALSPPFYPGDRQLVEKEARKIAEEQAVNLWYEENRDIPAAHRLNWFVIYKFPEALEQYRRLRDQGYNPALHFEHFFDLLSYGTAWIEDNPELNPRLRESRATTETFARVLLKPGDWPIPE